MVTIALEEQHILNQYLSTWTHTLCHPPQRYTSITALIFRKVSEENLLNRIEFSEQDLIRNLNMTTFGEDDEESEFEKRKKKKRKINFNHPMAGFNEKVYMYAFL